MNGFCIEDVALLGEDKGTQRVLRNFLLAAEIHTLNNVAADRGRLAFLNAGWGSRGSSRFLAGLLGTFSNGLFCLGGGVCCGGVCCGGDRSEWLAAFALEHRPQKQ